MRVKEREDSDMNAMRPLKVGITCYPSVGGSGVIATMLGVGLAELGHEVHFISYDPPFRLPKNMPRVHFHKVNISSYGLFKYPDYTLPLSVEMARVCCENQLDILHVHYAVPHATAAVLALCMLPPEKRPKVVATLHGTDTTLLGADPSYGPAILHALRQSHAVTAVSQFLKNETRRVIGFDGPIEVIYNFFEPGTPGNTREEVRKNLGIKKDELVILHSSNLRPVKRFDLLLDAIAAVRPKESFKLLVLAGGDFAQYEERVRGLGLEDRIIVKANVLEIDDYLACADLALYTSETESFCLSILEAMFFGCPSVSTNVGGIPEVVRDRIDGLLVPFGNPQELTRAIESLIRDPELRATLGRNASAVAHSRFTTEIIVPQYLDLYYGLLNIKQRELVDSARKADCCL